MHRRHLVAVLCLLVGGCATTPRGEEPEVVIRALALIGTPYRYGGEDPVRGFDCSGLVRHVYREGAGLDLPRRSEDMGRVGTPVSRQALVPGDLLFFNTLARPYSHVAIYIGDGRFVHAPTSKGVVRVESLDQHYWLSRYDGARRVAAPAGIAPNETPRDLPSL
jgi:cell wall-associated NlpC family hydrolase